MREEIAHCNTIILYLFMPFIFQQCSVNEKEDHIASIGKDLSQEIRFSFQFDTILWLHGLLTIELEYIEMQCLAV